MEHKDRNIFSNARITKDSNFDGKFYFAVKTTGIFCRPSCPAPTAKEENVEYFNNLFSALEHGYRPCFRCRPDINLEYHNSYIHGSEKVNEALELIYNGYLNYNSIGDLADTLYISKRQLRKLFSDSIGLPPVKIGRYHKSIFAKKLITNSNRTITDIAFASGFQSSRQFNDTYKEIFGETPSATRKCCSAAATGNPSLLLKYKQPFNYPQILSFMQSRLITGIEMIENQRYFRTFRTDHARGWFSVQDRPDQSALELKIICDDVRCYMEIYYRVRKMFDIDTDFDPINKMFEKDPLISRGMNVGQVPRLPIAFNPFEFTVRAILGQQITIKAATTLAGRIVEKAGISVSEDFPSGLEFLFPNAKELAATPLENLGITGIRQQTIRTVTGAILDSRLSLSVSQGFETFEKDFSSLKGIGDWTVNYVAMRGLGMKDAFPASDLGIIKAYTEGGVKPPVKKIIKLAEKWRPYRSYAALCLWSL
jgi:AraC family transcriptional regulator of adaptative response / DNA-3-methyladenine glycosylase II